MITSIEEKCADSGSERAMSSDVRTLISKIALFPVQVLAVQTNCPLAGVDLTLAELSRRLAGLGVTLKVPALWQQLNKWELRFKKTLHASEQGREDVQQAREAWIQAQPLLDTKSLKFINETGMT
ncbi:MAG: hypothetical protein LBD06_00235, partial [Candidatus Accumulibacter sp.]|nr:hypothetical protein [Accumulibacter sp.]